MSGSPPGTAPSGNHAPLLENRYRLQKELGRGAVGIVYLAIDERLDRKVAIKLLHPEQRDTETERRFVVEARAAAKLNHPSLCPVFDVGRHGDQLFLVMAYLHGVPLSELTRRDSRLPVAWIRTIICQVAEGMAVAHQSNIVHCDLKPDNILIRHDDRRAVVMDFGLAAAASEATEPGGRPRLMGSPAYMSPEQSRHERGNIGPASDIYSLGATLYEALSGRLPFEGSVEQVLSQLRDPETSPDPVEWIRQDVPSDLACLCMKMLSKSIEKRPASMHQIARWLGDSGAQLTIPPMLQPPAESPPTLATLEKDSRPPRLTQSSNAQIRPIRPPRMETNQKRLKPKRKLRLRRLTLSCVLFLLVAIAVCFIGYRFLGTSSSVNASNRPTKSDPIELPLPVPPEASEQERLPFRVPEDQGSSAVKRHLSRISDTQGFTGQVDSESTPVGASLNQWQTYPPHREGDWEMQSLDFVGGPFGIEAPSVCYYPLPVCEFSMAFHRLDSIHSPIEILWMDQPGISSTASARLRFEPGKDLQVKWQCYQTDRKQTYAGVRERTTDRVIISGNRTEVTVNVDGIPKATFSRTGGGSIAGYIGIRQTSLNTRLRNPKFVDRTVDRQTLWTNYPWRVYVDTETSYFHESSLDFCGDYLSVIQQFGGDLSSALRPLRRGTLWELTSRRQISPVLDSDKTLHYVGPTILANTSPGESVSLMTSREMGCRRLDPVSKHLLPAEKFRTVRGHWNAWFDVHHRWLIQKTYPNNRQTEYHLLGVDANGDFEELARTGPLPTSCDRADFAAGTQRWITAGGTTWHLLSAEGEVLSTQTTAAPVQALAIDPSGGQAIVATNDQKLIRFTIDSNGAPTVAQVVSITGSKQKMVYSPDGTFVCLKLVRSDLNLVLRANDLSLHRVIGSSSGVGVFSPDSRSLVVPHRSDGAVKVWRIDHSTTYDQSWTRDPSSRSDDRESLRANDLPQ